MQSSLAWSAILAGEPGTVVTMCPVDHPITPEGRLGDVLHRASRLARVFPEHVIVLGARPRTATGDHGYLVVGEEVWGTDGVRSVSCIVERPTATQARELCSRGAMWNTMIGCATVGALRRVLDQLGTRELSSELLSRAAARLLALPLDGVEWRVEPQGAKRNASLQVVSTSAMATRAQSNVAISAFG